MKKLWSEVGDYGFVMPENIAKNTDLCPQARKRSRHGMGYAKFVLRTQI
jgi:hypothetical protein